MSDTPSSPDRASADPAPPVAPPAPPRVQAGRGIGVVGAFLTGIVSSCLVLAGALVSLPYWPAEIRTLWRGEAAVPGSTPALDLQAVRQDAAAAATATVTATRAEMTGRLDDLEKRLRALSATAAERPGAAPAPSSMPDPAIAELRRKVEALESRAPTAPAADPAPPTPSVAAPNPDQEKEISSLKLEIATLRTALQSLDLAVSGQRDQAKVLTDAVDKARSEASARGAGAQKALAAANASAVISIAARLSAALDSDLPFAADLKLLAPLAQGDAKLGEIVTALQPYAQSGVSSRAALAATFPAMAKAALADDVADNSFGERLMGKVRNLVSLRRVGADVPGDSVEAKLARAEAAVETGDLGKAVELVKSMPPQTARATAEWLSRAEDYLAAKRAIDQLAAQAVALLGATR